MTSDELTMKLHDELGRLIIAIRSATWRNATGLAPTQQNALTLIASSAQRKVRPTDLASYLRITAQTASTTIASLVDKNLIRKVLDRSDGRCTNLILTREGEFMVRSILKSSTRVLSALADLPADERHKLLSTLQKLRLSLDQHSDLRA